MLRFEIRFHGSFGDHEAGTFTGDFPKFAMTSDLLEQPFIRKAGVVYVADRVLRNIGLDRFCRGPIRWRVRSYSVLDDTLADAILDAIDPDENALAACETALFIEQITDMNDWHRANETTEKRIVL